MAKRTQSLSVFPRQGGVVTSTDPGMLAVGQLVQGDNITFIYDDSTKRRDGINHNWDDYKFSPFFRSSSGTTRTLVGLFDNTGLSTSYKVSVSGAAAATYNVTLGAVTAFTQVSLTISGVNTSTNVITVSGTPSNGDILFYSTTANSIAELSANTPYYVVNASGSDIQLSLTSGGTPIDLSSAGSGTQLLRRDTLSYTVAGSLSESITSETAAYQSNKVVGGIDFWFGNQDTRSKFLISVLDNGQVFRTVDGTRTLITDAGKAWTIPTNGLTEANCAVLQNKVVVAVSGATNQMKYWDGDTGQPLKDLPGLLALTSVSRASSGTTRTLVMSGAVTIDNGEELVVISSVANYTGTYTLASGSGTATITYTATNSLSEGTTADTTIKIGTFAPLSSFVREHQGRLFCNDKTNLDRLHYSEVEDIFTWSGIGTSGALDIATGDGDPGGLTGIAPPFKGDLFVGKQTKIYRLIGDDPDNYIVKKQSNGIGFLSHQAITAVDHDDIFFVSRRGIHSLISTDAYGDYVAAYLSADIQKSFNEDWSASRRNFIKAAYFPELNSVAFAVTEGSGASNNAIWLYNVPKKIWYRWPTLECETLIASQDTDKQRAYLGTLRGRLSQTLDDNPRDTTILGEAQSILSTVKTGLIFPDNRVDTVKGFKRLMLVYSSQGTYAITASVKVDNFAPQALSYAAQTASTPLGTFILGEDILGQSFVLSPYSQPIDGYGRGFQLTIQQSDQNPSPAIQGFILEFEGAGDQPETRGGDDS